MKRAFDINPPLSAQALNALMVGLALAIAPHIARIPLWLTGVLASLVIWRQGIQRGYLRFPGKTLRTLLVLVLTVLFILAYRWQYTVESAVAFLVLAYCLKLSELVTLRDGYLFCFLTLFLAALNFLFSQSVLLTLYVLAVYVCVLLSMMALNGALRVMSLGRAGRVGMFALLIALPLTAALYLFAPRLAPLWQMPVPSEGAFTGLGEDLRFGEVASLAQSDERAFRVTFAGDRPPQNQLYWRSIILDGFDGSRWFRTLIQQQRDRQAVPVRSMPPGEPAYRVWVEPHNRRWAFVLEAAEVTGEGVYRTPDNLPRFVAPLNHPAVYDVWPNTLLEETTLSWQEQQRYLRLPRFGNPAARELAARLSERYPDPAERVTALLSRFREGQYRYTLKPPPLQGAHRIDAFLFSTLSGFCEHFAGATAFVLRASGIPARVIAGYQGGAWNEDGQFMVIRQYDAHAWVEAWLPGKGWARLDPTAWVAPERVELGLREAVEEEGSFLEDAPLSLNRYAHVPLWAWLGNQMEEINFQWYKWVVQFDSQRHSALLQKLFGRSDLRTALWATVGGVVVLMLMAAIWLLWRPARAASGGATAELGAWLRHRLRKKGVWVTPDLSLRELVERCKQGWPEAERPLCAWERKAERLLYATALPEAELRHEIRELKHQFRKIRLQGLPRTATNQERTA